MYRRILSLEVFFLFTDMLTLSVLFLSLTSIVYVYIFCNLSYYSLLLLYALFLLPSVCLRIFSYISLFFRNIYSKLLDKTTEVNRSLYILCKKKNPTPTFGLSWFCLAAQQFDTTASNWNGERRHGFAATQKKRTIEFIIFFC